jgi:hypothetical protein
MSGMGRLPKMKDQTALKGGTAFEEDAEESLPELPPVASPFGAEEETEIDIFHRRMGGRAEDLPLAQRVFGWKQNEIPNASLPEAIVYDYLKLSGRPFVYQYMVFGGRGSKGGLVPDFLVENGGQWLVWNVQGEYYHSEAFNKGRDKSFRYRILGAIIMGMKVQSVVELWENDVYHDRPAIWELAWGGRGMRE